LAIEPAIAAPLFARRFDAGARRNRNPVLVGCPGEHRFDARQHTIRVHRRALGNAIDQGDDVALADAGQGPPAPGLEHVDLEHTLGIAIGADAAIGLDVLAQVVAHQSVDTADVRHDVPTRLLADSAGINAAAHLVEHLDGEEPRLSRFDRRIDAELVAAQFGIAVAAIEQRPALVTVLAHP